MSKPVPLIQFKQYVETLINSKKDFVVQTKRGVNVLTYAGKVSFISKEEIAAPSQDALRRREILTLFSNVAKNVNSYIEKSGMEIEIVKQKSSSTYSNSDLFKEMATGDVFYYVDISHCFWRIAYLKGYIKENLYKSILDKPNLKIFRNMALSCIIAPAKKEYYKGGQLLTTIIEDKNLHKVIYDNIRFTAYNLMGDIKRDLDIEVIGYRTDGIMVMPKDVNNVIDYIEGKGFFCKTKECVKIDDKHYENELGENKHF